MVADDGGVAADDFVGSLLERAREAGADAARALHVASEKFEINFDSRRTTLLRTTRGDSATLTVFRDGRKGSATMTGCDRAAVDGAVQAAVSAAAAAMPDPANGIADVISAPPARHGDAVPDRAAMLDRVAEHIEAVAAAFPDLVTRESRYDFTHYRRRFANSAGRRQQEERGCYGFAALFAGRRAKQSTSFNYHGVASFAPFRRLLDIGALRRSFADAVQSFDPKPVPAKFVGDVIVSPDAAGGMLAFPLARVLAGYALLAGTSPYKERIGKRVANPFFSLLNTPRAADLPHGADFDNDGIPTRDLAVIEGGVLKNFLVDHYVAKKLGIGETAGHWALRVPAGATPFEDMVRQTKRGILLARFSGGAPNDNLDFSGIAKNSFYIENGEIRHPLIETMVSGNLQRLIENIRAVSRESVNFGDSCYPYIAAGGMTISGKN